MSAGFNYLINIHSRRITMQNMLTNNTCIEAKRWNEKALAIGTDIQRAPSFSTLIFHDFSLTKKMKIHDLSAQHKFPSKRYTAYECIPECIPELVVTVPSARSTIVK